jgi:UDP-glucose 4-epimerase
MTKLDVEFLLDMARREHGLGYTALRYFNVYGPRQDVNSDYSAVIPIFIKRAIQNVDLTVYGTGEQRRDFVYVEDVARAVMTFAVNDIAGVFNVGTGKDYSLLELADIILKKTGSKSKLKFEEVRPGDVNFSTASLGKQMKTKVWMPRVSFEDGIGRTIEFYRANPEF